MNQLTAPPAYASEVLAPYTPEGPVPAEIVKARFLGALTVNSAIRMVSRRPLKLLARLAPRFPAQSTRKLEVMPELPEDTSATADVPMEQAAETPGIDQAQPETVKQQAIVTSKDKIKTNVPFERGGGRARWVKCSMCKNAIREKLAARVPSREKEGTLDKVYCCQNCSPQAVLK